MSKIFDIYCMNKDFQSPDPAYLVVTAFQQRLGGFVGFEGVEVL